jgi:hypothetical protein
MNHDQAQTYLAALASSLTIGVIIPLLILLGLAGAIWLLISKAQTDPNFDVANVLRDENGKESSERLLTFACFAVTSWVMAVAVFALPNLLIEIYITYSALWGGTAAAKEIVKRKWPGKDQT